MSLASLPMYDRPELRGAHDRYWRAIRAELGEGPEYLTRAGDVWDHWLSPDLLLSQTCGYPFRAHLHGKVTLVGTPDHGIAGCPPGHYCSVFVARAEDARASPEDFAEARFAYNEALSQSGWAAPQALARSEGFAFRNLVETGGHAASARAVAEGRADIAALDALSWRLMRRHDRFAAALKEVGRTPPTPALPYITARTRPARPLFDAIEAAIEALAPEDRAALSLEGLVPIPAADYIAVPTPPPPDKI